MARLRSASVAKTPRADSAPEAVTPGSAKPTTTRTTSQSTKLNTITERQTPDQHPDSAVATEDPPVDSLPDTTPNMPKSKLPKKGKLEPATPMKKSAAFKLPEGEGSFGFKFSSSLATQGRKLLNNLTGKKTPAAAPPPATPATPSTKPPTQEEETPAPRGSQTEPRPLKKKKRFSDIHRTQFSKMDSIATHYAANRTTPNPLKPPQPPAEITPKNAVQTPEMAPKGIKRSKSQAVPTDREIPVSPSPVKTHQPRMSADNDNDDDNPSPVKRQKLDPATAALTRKPSKIARLAAGTPMKPQPRFAAAPNTVATGALGKGLFLKAPSSTRKLPALPRPVGRLNLTPATMLSATPSKIPTTPGRPPRVRGGMNAPPTAGGSKLNTMINFTEAAAASTPGGGVMATPAKGTPRTVGGFTFRSRGSGLGFGALSEIHKKKMEMPVFAGGLGTPKVSENDPVGVEDPFGGEEKGRGVGRKRKGVEETVVEEEEEEEEKQEVQEEKEEVSATPARKKMRFDTESTREEPGEEEKPQTLAEAVAKANRKRRLNFLATPKKRVAGEGDKLGRGRSLW